MSTVKNVWVNTMASIIYLPARNGLEKQFRAFVKIAIPEKKFEFCRSIEELSQRLRRPNVKVAVLFAMSQEEMGLILSLGDLMEDVKSLLILADQDKDLMTKAHRLRPRYVTWADCNMADVVTVLKKMVELYDVPTDD